jgi:hypothetical protein
MNKKLKHIHRLMELVHEGKTQGEEFNSLFGAYATGHNKPVLLREGRASLTPIGQNEVFSGIAEENPEALKIAKLIQQTKAKPTKTREREVIPL